MKAAQLTEPDAEHGEGPVWWPSWGGLRWVDLFAGDMLTLRGDGTVARRHLGSALGSLRPRAGGGMVMALDTHFALTDAWDEEPRPFGNLRTSPGVRLNDGGCDPQGRFYCGSMAHDSAPGAGCLYRLDPDGSTRVLLRGVTVSNGIGWSPDGGTGYYIDTGTHRLDAFDHDPDRGLSGRRPLARIDEALPDGLAVDAEGGIWVALMGGGAVNRYRPDGTLEDRVELPVRQVTACAFGGPRLDELFITTSRVGFGIAEEPEAGAVFRADVGVAGLPALPFAG